MEKHVLNFMILNCEGMCLPENTYGGLGLSLVNYGNLLFLFDNVSFYQWEASIGYVFTIFCIQKNLSREGRRKCGE